MDTDLTVIAGAGLTGSVIGRILAEAGYKILIIDRRNHIAGNIYDYKDGNGITIHKYGPHIFHTNNELVWSFLSKFTEWKNFSFEPNVVINGKSVTLPFNLTTIHEVFDKGAAKKYEHALVKKYGLGNQIPITELKKSNDADIQYIADFVYDNVFLNYTIKQWGISPEEIDKSVIGRVPVRISYDNRYFLDKYQGIPLNGYTNMVKNILNHENITIQLNTEFKNLRQNFKRVIFTGAADEYFNYEYGELPYRSLHFDIKTINQEYYQKTAMVNYPNDYDFTRITEHKYFLDEKSDKTVISIEYPQAFVIGQNERFYPINNDKSIEIHKKYLSKAEQLENIYFAGRLGDFKYYNMDIAVEKAIEFTKKLI